MARFPSWIRKTMWRRFTASEQQNAIEAMQAVSNGSGVGALRGIPPDPAWIKGEPGRNRARDVQLLYLRMSRRLARESSEARQRAVTKRNLQMTCTHPEWSQTRTSKMCLTCGLIA